MATKSKEYLVLVENLLPLIEYIDSPQDLTCTEISLSNFQIHANIQMEYWESYNHSNSLLLPYTQETLDLLKLAFGNENVNKPTTFRWFSRFKNGMESVKDEKRVGRPILHRNPEKVSQISNLIKENPRIGLRDIEEETEISKSLVGSIIIEDLQLKKTPSNLSLKCSQSNKRRIALKLPKNA
ncbi:hypothetical protein LAZ67_6003307 [Cordylochernes scorpioides]|uniref:Transposase n=1 Tax=Cordylochernes scorpioides TaxID=51811 RepID=A0ABY6KKH4_9ARAC|nr:hypothetical protein LAZ67_6003307 [Cordylochernes scorpioides]